MYLMCIDATISVKPFIINSYIFTCVCIQVKILIALSLNVQVYIPFVLFFHLLSGARCLDLHLLHKSLVDYFNILCLTLFPV